MRKEYIVTCEVNMCADHIEEVRIITNLSLKAEEFAEDILKKRGFRNVKVLGCKEAPNQ